MQATFVKTVQQYFQFLIDDFGFKLLKAISSPRDEPWEGNVQYVTSATLIDISMTRGDFPSLSIGRTKDMNKHLLPLQVAYEFVELNDEEKIAILSRFDGQQAAKILNNKQLLHVMSQVRDIDAEREFQIKTLAASLRKYALPLLQGDFSQWIATWEYQVDKLIAENARTGRPEFVPVVVADTDGKFKVTGKEHVFKKTLDYLQGLRDEQKK